MRKIYFVCIILAGMVFFVFSMPTGAVEYMHTRTGFRYIGDFFHEKEIEYFGGSGGFQVRGFGETHGSHNVHTVRYPDGDSKVNVRLYFRGSTDPDYAETIAREEEQLLAHVKARREQAIADLNRQKRNSPMSGEDYYDAMMEINRYFDNLVSEIIASYSEAKKNVLIQTSNTIVNSGYTSRVRVGISMDPGETGYISQTVASYSGDEDYLRIRNNFENTGGTTKHENIVEGFVSERMVVEGYAKVSQSTTVREGNARTGWFDTPP